MKQLGISLLAAAGRTKSCEGIGDTITKLRSKGPSCDTARTLAAKWPRRPPRAAGA